MFDRQRDAAFSLMELLVTLAVVGVLFGISTITLMGYIPKSRLNDTARLIELSMQRAQSEAQSRGLITGVHFYKAGSGNDCFWHVCYDNYNSGSGNTDQPDGKLTLGTGKDSCGPKRACKRSVVLLKDSDCTGVTVLDPGSSETDVTHTSVVYFKPSGEVFKEHDTTAGQLDPHSWEIFIRSLDLDKAANERSIEILSTGLMNMPKSRDAGYLPGEADTSCGTN